MFKLLEKATILLFTFHLNEGKFYIYFIISILFTSLCSAQYSLTVSILQVSFIFLKDHFVLVTKMIKPDLKKKSYVCFIGGFCSLVPYNSGFTT